MRATSKRVEGKEGKPSGSSSPSFLGSSVINNPSAKQKMRVRSLVWEDPPWRRKWQPIPVFLTRKSQGHRNLAGSAGGHKRVGDDLAYSPGSSSRTPVLGCSNTILSP